MAGPNVGEILAGKYRVERVLGQGGMGMVVAATHLVLGHQVALKYLLPSAGLRAETIARFLREAQVTALVSQPGGRVYACTSNPARVHLLDTGLASTGSYTSAVADAGHEARWGAISWDADNPAGTRVELKTRSGDRPSPDESWSAWSPPYAVGLRHLRATRGAASAATPLSAPADGAPAAGRWASI